jgi:D-alanyl-D-alanine carboxypeptidase
MSEDGAILYQELIKVSELIKHIFSTEQFDLNKIKLYKKEVNIKEFLISEISVLKAAHL